MPVKRSAAPATKNTHSPAAIQSKKDTGKTTGSENGFTADAPMVQMQSLIHTSDRLQTQSDQVQTLQKKNDTGMPDQLKSGIESLSGLPMDDVKVHYDSAKPAQLNALAYAQGTDIHLSPGQEKHLPHEAWHVAQQKQGRVKPTKQLKKDTGAPSALTVQRVEGSAAGDLEQFIVRLREELSGSGEESEGVAELKEQIGELQNILDSGDADLIGETLEAIQSGLEEHAGDLHAPGTEETSGGEKGVVQGVAGYPALMLIGTMLSYIGSWIWANPVKAIILAKIIQKALSYRSRLQLPKKLGAGVFNNNRLGYYFLVERKINLFRRIHNLSDHDEELLKKKAKDALEGVRGENDYLYNTFPEELSKDLDDYDENNMAALLGPDGINLTNSIFTDIGSALNKKLDHANVPEDEKKGFAEALKALPFVQSLYDGTIHKKMGYSEKEFKKVSKSGWKDGGTLTNSIEEVDDGNMFTRDRKQIDNGQFAAKVRKAEQFIRVSVSKAILGEVPRPVIKVHLRNESNSTRPWGFRAFQRNGEIHVAQDEHESIIVHELGHYIENNLPIKNWMDIQLLLHGRNNSQKKAGYIYPMNTFDEQRFNGSYPGTGPYTSKYYASGHTEVMSMSLEYMAHPAKFKGLIEKDPQQAAIIINLIRPGQFKSVKELDPYRKYIPH